MKSPRILPILFTAFSLSVACAAPTKTDPLANRAVYLVSNFHPASCGWLTNWSTERNYCANSYFSHLDRVRDDANYKFVLSECNNLIAMQNFRPERIGELKQRIQEGRVELLNAFFLESTVSLSGGEVLAKMGIEGMRWQQNVMGVKPRYCWAIDTCGIHDQMPQICKLLGLDALVYTRCARAGKSLFWSESPDGSKILTLSPGGYARIRPLFRTKTTLTDKEVGSIYGEIASLSSNAPSNAPLMFLCGSGDYSLPPENPKTPSEFLDQWKKLYPNTPIRFATCSDYIDTVLPDIRSGKVQIPTVPGGTGYTYDSFWIENPRIKTAYRSDEHALQTAETLATIASLKAGFDYPVQPLYHAWLLMLLNADRNTLWGSAGGMVFEHETSWDAKDRMEWVANQAAVTTSAALRKQVGSGSSTLLFNPLNWERSDVKLPSCGFGPTPAAEQPKPVALPAVIETPFYAAKLDPATGALVSLKAKPSGREMLGGPANVLVLEERTGKGDPGDSCGPRPKRPRIGSSSDSKTTVISASESAESITVEVRTEFNNARRLIRFNKHHPRIEFTTEVDDLPNLSVLVAEFPLIQAPTEIRRGIPFGFSRDENRIAGIVPAVRWIDYATPGQGGVSLLDRGLSGREINDKTAVIYLYNATEKYNGYPNAWLSGKGHHKFEYALVAHDSDWSAARVPQTAWEYNCPPVAVNGCAEASPASFLSTSPNVIVEAMRRDGADIEMRVVECLGQSGKTSVTLNLPHESARQTDLLGGNAEKLAGGPEYTFAVKPQQIVTLRFRTAKPVAEIEPLLRWDEMVPTAKRAMLNHYLPNIKGHPPLGH